VRHPKVNEHGDRSAKQIEQHIQRRRRSRRIKALVYLVNDRNQPNITKRKHYLTSVNAERSESEKAKNAVLEYVSELSNGRVVKIERVRVGRGK
jgi:hypothetical protein